MEAELQAFDKKNKKPLPPLIQKWRNRWVKMISANEIAKVSGNKGMRHLGHHIPSAETLQPNSLYDSMEQGQ